MEGGNKHCKAGERQERGRNPPIIFTLGRAQGQFSGAEESLVGLDLSCACRDAH